MRLALDTSSVACTVALDVGGTIFERHEEQAREHTRLLMPMIRAVLEEAQVSLAELDAIVLGNGPGSFIGLRIAASVAQGLAHGAGLKIIPVSSLAAIAQEVFDTSSAGQVAVAQDAHMSEVYLGLFSRGDDGSPVALCDERLQAQEVIEELAGNAGGFTFAGQGWQRYLDLMAINQRWMGAMSDVHYPRAVSLLRLSGKSEAIEPNRIQPAYLRQKVAEKPASRDS